MHDREVVIVEAVRSPVGRRNGALAEVHPADLLGDVLISLLDRAGIDAANVDQTVVGCVTAAGEQSYNVGRTGWLTAGLPASTPATTVDSQCGSSQQALNLAAGLVSFGAVETVVAAGVESMTRVPMGVNTSNGPGRAIPKSYFDKYQFTSQFQAADLIAQRWELTRAECDLYGHESQRRAALSISAGRFEREIVPIRKRDDANTVFANDECPRETTIEGLTALTPVLGEGGVHSAGTSSQIADGASAVLLMSRKRAKELGITVRATLTHQCLVGVDPVLNLIGPIDATRRILELSGLEFSDFDVIEINEAFASVVLAWMREFKPDPDRVNPNGGAIALGHPLGCTGTKLVTTALHELERRDATRALVTMCCGGGLGTATVIQREE